MNYLEFREKGKRGKSLLIGGLAGFGIGAIIGYVIHNPSNSFTGNDRTANAMVFGQLIAIPGLLNGNAYGRHRIKVSIQGSKKSIQAKKEELGKYKFGG